ncbi:MAG: sterol desaturase family protein [Ketobacteraceae bacterium]|nr:sterol desaturase family protein [Ketobacteraceae bacterium]
MSDVMHAVMFIFAFGALFITVIGIEAWYLHRTGRKHAYCWKETLTNMTMGLNYKLVDGIAVALVIRFFYDWVHQFGLQYEPVHGIFSVLLIFLISDVAFWFFHFTMHKVRWFWAVHVTHHSSERMNYSTALRQNFTLLFNGGWLFWWVPIALVGFDKNWATIAIELNLAYQFFLHTETKSPLDRFGWLLNTPSHHRVHHGSQRQQIDTNFGGVLIIWDRLFGTFVPESKAGTIQYGLTAKQPRSLNPFYLQLHEWIDLFRDLKRTRDVRVLIKGPNWQPMNNVSPTPDSDQRLEQSA